MAMKRGYDNPGGRPSNRAWILEPGAEWPQHDGRTLNDLCQHMDMTRQGVTQYLDQLEAANLVATVKRGRDKLHFLNPVPLQEIYERWLAKFEKPRLKALSRLKRKLEKPDG
jgi:DNA-binding transcriptional ArsR family regulator